MKFGREVENLIANLCGLPENHSRSRMRAPSPLDALLDSVVERYRVGQITPQQRIMEQWKELVGERNAHRCRPERIDEKKRLIVMAANSVIKQELLFQKSAILKRIQALPDCAYIRDIVISG